MERRGQSLAEGSTHLRNVHKAAGKVIVLRVTTTVLENLTRGVLHVSGAEGLKYVDLSLAERVRLMWVFRNFRILPQHVLPARQSAWLSRLCENGRVKRYTSTLDREIACVIGTLVTSEPALRVAHEERRRAARLPLHFTVRYGPANRDHPGPSRCAADEFAMGEGCDVSQTGIAFTGPRPFASGAEITVHFRWSGTGPENWTRTRAIVRNIEEQKPGLYRIGAEFSIIHPRDRAELRLLTAVAKNAD